MNAKLPAVQLLGLGTHAGPAPSHRPVRAELVRIEENGLLRVRECDGAEYLCEWLESGAGSAIALEAEDRLLVLPPGGDEFGVVLGRIASYRPPVQKAPEPAVVIEATETLTLKCGDASVDLRKDGKVMVRGDDVLLRAKKTQRIKAGSVAIN